jgi:amidase/aspartyl-tRNA(Asn)/glutamyl-tRNA(Gln) amidotransferase subunit A
MADDVTPAAPLDDAPELCRLSAAAMAEGFRTGAFSPVEVAGAALERCVTVGARLGAFALIDDAGARAAAEASAARWRAGAPLSPLDGVPATVKDIVWVRGLPVTYGSATVEPVTAGEDAPAVARLRAAGCVILGLTTTPEFGWKAVTDSPRWGVTRNPWNPALTPGGSSGGAAVAAATGCAPLNLGTDGGGSIRIPASFTGVAGFKQTYGRVAAHPLSVFGTVAHIGPIARGAGDAALMLDAMSGRDLRDWTQPPFAFAPATGGRFAFRGARVGFWRAPPVGAVDPEVAAAADRAVARMAAAGAEIEEIALPGEDLHGLFRTLWFSGAAARLAAVAPERRAGMDPGLLAVAEAGAAIGAPALALAHAERARFGAAMDALLARLDILVSPATPVAAFEAGRETPPGWAETRWTGWAGFSFPLNLSQQPAISTPCGFTADGRPVGLQIVAARGADATALAAAAAWETIDHDSGGDDV